MNGARGMRVSAFFPVAAIIALLCISSLPVSALSDAVNVKVENWDKRPPFNYGVVSFYYVYGDHISWWQGGIKLIYKPGSPEYEAAEELFIPSPEDLGIKVVQGELRLIAAQAHMVYAYRGIITYKNYMFVDSYGGLIFIDFEYGKSFNVTVYAQATINMTSSSISGYGKADWVWERVSPDVERLVREPVASVPSGSEILVVPSEGFVQSYSWKGLNYYLGGGPKLHQVRCGMSCDIIVKARQTFWDREPDYWLVFNGSGLAEIYLVNNWFNRAVLIGPAIPHEVIVVPARQP